MPGFSGAGLFTLLVPAYVFAGGVHGDRVEIVFWLVPLANCARGESLMDSNTWREAFLHSRCLIPVDSFIEWKRADAKTKLPWIFAMKDDELFALGGVQQEWRSPDGKTEMGTFAIITVEPLN